MKFAGPVMNGRKPVGQVKIKCKVDVGDTWDWVVAEYRRSEILAKQEKIRLKR